MTNPSPRPALRKAPDSHLHPALPAHNRQVVDLRVSASTVPEIDGSGIDGSGIDGPDRIPGTRATRDHAGIVKSPSQFKIEPADAASDRPPIKATKALASKPREKKSDQTESKAANKKGGANKKGKDTVKKDKSDKTKSGKTKNSTAKSKGKKPGKTDRIDLRRAISVDIRRQLRSTAKARGTSVEEVVTSVLDGWLPN